MTDAFNTLGDQRLLVVPDFVNESEIADTRHALARAAPGRHTVRATMEEDAAQIGMHMMSFLDGIELSMPPRAMLPAATA